MGSTGLDMYFKTKVTVVNNALSGPKICLSSLRYEIIIINSHFENVVRQVALKKLILEH
jgi:hypothetical protein